MGRFYTDKHGRCPSCHDDDTTVQKIILHDFACVPPHVFVANICDMCGYMYAVFPEGVYSVRDDGSIGARIPDGEGVFE